LGSGVTREIDRFWKFAVESSTVEPVELVAVIASVLGLETYGRAAKYRRPTVRIMEIMPSIASGSFQRLSNLWSGTT